jgi:hypothetical protein
MTTSLFISYRREDTAGYAGRIADDLREYLPGVSIFRDIETIAAGEDFVLAIQRALARSRVLLALIGPEWLTAKSADGQRRLDALGDFVRVEIAMALDQGHLVIPVLLQDAELPREDELPEPLRPLLRRQAIELSDPHWERDIEALARRLQDALNLPAEGGGRQAVTQSSSKRGAWFITTGIAVAVGLTAGIWWLTRDCGGGNLLLARGPEVLHVAGEWVTSTGIRYSFCQRGDGIALKVQDPETGVVLAKGDGIVFPDRIEIRLEDMDQSSQLPESNWTLHYNRVTRELEGKSPSGEESYLRLKRAPIEKQP